MEGLVDTSRQRKLLILYLFIGNIAADCPIPHDGDLIILTEESLIKHDFPHGTVITYQCKRGNDKLSGTGEMTCVNGNWTEPDITCRRQDCGPPAAKPHMIFHLRQGTLYGAMATITCEEGYRIIGWSTRICVGTRWIGKGNCTRIICRKPTKVKHGEHSWKSHDKPQYKQNIHFSCHKGYTLFGNKTITCTETGKYDFEHPQCIVDCPKPRKRENLVIRKEYLKKKIFPDGIEINYKCRLGYIRVNGTGAITCINGKWTEPDITCRKKDCGPLKPQPHMIFNTSKGTLFGATVYVSCEEGFRLIGPNSKQCLNTGWFGTANCEEYSLLLTPVVIFAAVGCSVGFIFNILCIWRRCSYDTREERTTEPLQFHTL